MCPIEKPQDIINRFKEIQTKNPKWSSFVCFIKSVKGTKFSLVDYKKLFNSLVEKDDYAKEDKKEIVEYLTKNIYKKRLIISN